MTLPVFTWKSASLTNVGKVRKVNEDAFLDLPQIGLWVVADGMGGHDAGDVASSMIVEALGNVGEHARPSDFLNDVEDRLFAVNRRLFEIAAEAEQPVTIGSTVVAMLAFGNYCLSVWAGDSRTYRLRDGRLRQITRDHSQVEEMVEQGEILRENAEDHPLANVITRAVGGSESLYLDLKLQELKDGDRYMLCSDGLYKDVMPDEISSCLSRGSCAEASSELIDLVLEREAADNVTVAVIDFAEAEQADVNA
ncbi:MAG: protein phosphatase 2C domain-containing protein [Pseudomonadota bacterium]